DPRAGLQESAVGKVVFDRCTDRSHQVLETSHGGRRENASLASVPAKLGKDLSGDRVIDRDLGRHAKRGGILRSRYHRANPDQVHHASGDDGVIDPTTPERGGGEGREPIARLCFAVRGGAPVNPCRKAKKTQRRQDRERSEGRGGKALKV